ncbi:hypothetical protein D3C77_769950 [compost metagenome]|jgi:hypothetical protein|uniref:hypothetical protein n=1 Tax=Pseudomonas sp. PLMAX TaxID=2201998 RepID=UPI000FAF6198
MGILEQLRGLGFRLEDGNRRFELSVQCRKILARCRANDESQLLQFSVVKGKLKAKQIPSEEAANMGVPGFFVRRVA